MQRGTLSGGGVVWGEREREGVGKAGGAHRCDAIDSGRAVAKGAYAGLWLLLHVRAE